MSLLLAQRTNPTRTKFYTTTITNTNLKTHHTKALFQSSSPQMSKIIKEIRLHIQRINNYCKNNLQVRIGTGRTTPNRFFNTRQFLQQQQEETTINHYYYYSRWTLNPAGFFLSSQCRLNQVKGLFSSGSTEKVNFLRRRESKHGNLLSSDSDICVHSILDRVDKTDKSLSVGRRSTWDEMSSSRMMLPIIGSPPGPDGMGLYSSSPMDDIATLTGAFAAEHQSPGSNGRNVMSNRRFTLRRKLSTSFDDPVSSGLLANLAGIAAKGEKGEESGGDDGSSVFSSKGGSFGSGSGIGMGINRGSSAPQGIGATGGGAWLEEHFRKFMGLRISEGSDGDGDDASSVGSSGSGGGRGGGSGVGGSQRIHEDIFLLLEKVIGFKGRNVSHITVEQSVKDLCTVYTDTDKSEKLKFFNLLGEKYGVDHPTIVSLANSLSSCQEQQTRLNLEEKLRAALIPKYQWLFSQVGRLDNGVKFLVDLRTDILDAIEKSTESTTHLKSLNNCLKDLIGVWFAVGFLKLERITWNSSCEMLQKISEYEAVHPMRNWTDLKKRVGPNRRCFVFTHGSMPEEPVVVLHTALTDHIPSCIHKIVTKRRQTSLDTDSDMSGAEEVEDRDFINTAVFYSITSTQRGLTGIELGNYLIKRVVRELQMEFPKINQYSSLSPIPGFSKWLIGSIKTAQRDPDSQNLLTKAEIDALTPIFQSKTQNNDFFGMFLDSMKLNQWYSDGKLIKEFESPLMRLCGQYLYLVKRRGYAMDPVAHFHLKNGAVLWRLNWLADASPRGLSNSCGIMVNYRYFLEECESNSQTYLEQQIIQTSDQVRLLVKKTETEIISKI